MIELFRKLLHFIRKHQTQMTAFQIQFRDLRHITKDADTKLLLDLLFYLRIKHGRHPVEDHPFDMAFFFISEKTFDLCKGREAHATGIHDENCRGSGHGCQIIGTGLRIDPAQSVIITHNAFYHRNIRILSPPFHQITGGLFIRKKGIQIPGLRSQHTGMKHGIDVIRPAFKRRNSKTSLS